MKVAAARHAQRTVPQAAFARCRCPEMKRCGIVKAACHHTRDRSPALGGSNRGWCLADAEPRSCILDQRRSCLRGLTFELSRHQRCDARARVAKMYSVPPAGPAWHAVGARLERGVRPRLLETHMRLIQVPHRRGGRLRLCCASRAGGKSRTSGLRDPMSIPGTTFGDRARAGA